MDHQDFAELLNEKIVEIMDGNEGELSSDDLVGGLALKTALIMIECGVCEIEVGNMKLTLTEK